MKSLHYAGFFYACKLEFIKVPPTLTRYFKAAGHALRSHCFVKSLDMPGLVRINLKP